MLRILAMLPLLVLPTLATAQEKSPQEQWQALLFMAACAGHYQAAHNAALAASQTDELVELEGKLAVQRTARVDYFAASALAGNDSARRVLAETESKIAGNANAMPVENRGKIWENCDRATEQIIAEREMKRPPTDFGSEAHPGPEENSGSVPAPESGQESNQR
ncbi:MAG: hypothetical protein IIA30_14415 [Myxococcales bacterium]|nr:hypothetical protein [Myxococcales bacterium]